MSLGPSDLDDLYGAPLAEFVRVRKALGARLRTAGRADDAAQVDGLKKPSAAVWAINQAVRQDRVAVERLLRSVERVRALQIGRAPGDPEALRTATTEQRDAVEAVADRAAAALRSAGAAPSRDTLERIATTLQAAAVSEDDRALLRRGQLREEREPAGFGAFAGTPLPSAVRRSKSATAERERAKPARLRDERRKSLAESLARSRADLEALRRRASQAEAEAAERRREADEAERAAERARKAAERLAAEIERAEGGVREAERALATLDGAS